MEDEWRRHYETEVWCTRTVWQGWMIHKDIIKGRDDARWRVWNRGMMHKEGSVRRAQWPWNEEIKHKEGTRKALQKLGMIHEYIMKGRHDVWRIPYDREGRFIKALQNWEMMQEKHFERERWCIRKALCLCDTAFTFKMSTCIIPSSFTVFPFHNILIYHAQLS